MNAEIESHHGELRRTVLRLVQRTSSLARIRALRGTAPGFEIEVWKKMADQGWLGVTVPESHGGFGLRLLEAAIIAEEFGKALMPEPLLAALSLGTSALVHSENERLRSRVLPAICGGKQIVSLAWQESSNVLDAIPRITRISEGAGKAKLRGEKLFVWPVAGVHGFIVSAMAPKGVGLYWVPGDTPGLSCTLAERADGSMVGHLRFADVAVDTDQIVIEPQVGEAVLRQTLDEATALACAEMLGVMKRSLEITIEYLKMRTQFGRPIGSFQVLQHRAVDLFIQQELSAAVVDETIKTLDGRPNESTRAAAVSRAKARCSDAVVRICREGIQLHGAIGFTDACDIGLYLKRALVLAAWLGNSTLHRARFAASAPLEPA